MSPQRMREPYYSDAAVTLHHGDALEVLRSLPDASVDCCVTSPPYFGLRAYSDDEREIGRENSPAEFVESLRDIFREVSRVLTDDGVLWVNIGDTWYSGRGNPGPSGFDKKNMDRRGWQRSADTRGRLARPPWRRAVQRSVDRPGQPWGRPKSLIGVPWRLAFALMDDGWILRQEVIWAKRNCTPDPAEDRPGRAHEQVFMLTKGPRYWFDARAIREESDPNQQAHNERYAKVYDAHTERADGRQPGNQNSKGIHSRPGDPGRHPRSVWSISAQPFPGNHPATMPPGLAEKCIKAGCKPGGTVLDPFSGSGTTGLVAGQLGRRYIGIDISADYLALSLRTRLAQSALIDTEEQA